MVTCGSDLYGGPLLMRGCQLNHRSFIETFQNVITDTYMDFNIPIANMHQVFVLRDLRYSVQRIN